MKHKITCQHCKSRYLNCHSECSDYIAYRKERDEILEIKANKINGGATIYVKTKND